MDDLYDGSRCYRCTYSLAGLAASTCPECGADVSPPAIQRAKRRAATRAAIIDWGALPAAVACATLGWWIFIRLLMQTAPRPNGWQSFLPLPPFLFTFVCTSVFFTHRLRKQSVQWPAVLGTVFGILIGTVLAFVGLMALAFLQAFIPPLRP